MTDVGPIGRNKGGMRMDVVLAVRGASQFLARFSQRVRRPVEKRDPALDCLLRALRQQSSAQYPLGKGKRPEQVSPRAGFSERLKPLHFSN
jgi:hypothetical protein